MRDFYPMWKMCKAFREREMSRNTDFIKKELISKGEDPDSPDFSKKVIIERSHAKDFPLQRGELVGAYTHRFFPKLRKDENKVDAGKLEKYNPGALDEAERALKNCIDAGYIVENPEGLLLHGTGRTFVDEPIFFGINLRLVIAYLRLLDPLHGIVLGTLSYAIIHFGKAYLLHLKDFPMQVVALIDLIRYH